MACSVTSQPFPGVYHCTFTEVPSYNFMFWVSVMLFDTILFILALGLIYKWWFQPPLEETLRLRCSCPTLVVILLRDNLGHCFRSVLSIKRPLFLPGRLAHDWWTSAFALYTITVVVCLTTDASYASIPPSFIYAVTTVMGTRLILNLCDAFHNPSTNNQSRESCEWDAAVSCFTCVPPVVFAPMPINDAAMTWWVELDVETQYMGGWCWKQCHIQRILDRYGSFILDIRGSCPRTPFDWTRRGGLRGFTYGCLIFRNKGIIAFKEILEYSYIDNSRSFDLE